MVPSRDSLLITGSDDEVGLGMMLDLAEKAADTRDRQRSDRCLAVGDLVSALQRMALPRRRGRPP
jgi:hypothetical protein